MAPIKILEKIRKGLVVLHAVTVPEGFTMEQIADLLAEKGLIQKEMFLRLANNPRALSAYGVERPASKAIFSLIPTTSAAA